jgi:hypothetical protein
MYRFSCRLVFGVEVRYEQSCDIVCQSQSQAIKAGAGFLYDCLERLDCLPAYLEQLTHEDIICHLETVQVIWAFYRRYSGWLQRGEKDGYEEEDEWVKVAPTLILSASQ